MKRTAGKDGQATERDARNRLVAGLPVTERELDVSGARTAVLEGGTGTPIVILHGPGEFAARWLRVIPDLVRDHRVIVPDLPGHGASELPPGEPTADRVIDWLEEVMARTTAEPPVVVGHILGGAIAARLAIERPERIRSLVLVDSLGLAPFRPSPRFALALLAFLALPGKRSYEHFMSQCEYDRETLADDVGDAWVAIRDYLIDRARDPRSKAAMLSLMKNVGIPAIPPARLEDIAVPVTLIWGRHDRALRLSIAEAASARYGWPLHVIEDAADDAPLEQPRAFLAALSQALEAMPVPAGDAQVKGGI